ncbi:MAG: hypothetical protein LBU51_00330, partial [Bacteroidales bacterium]|nr:hypothetical protein [Bacteroidales bacterium]
MKRSKSLFGIEIYIVESYHSRQSKEATVVSVFTDTIYYIHTDLLGSYNVITDQNKNVVNTLQFDPWGNRRLYNDWRKSDTCTHLFDRGFTGHEHLDIFKIINMNGRL